MTFFRQLRIPVQESLQGIFNGLLRQPSQIKQPFLEFQKLLLVMSARMSLVCHDSPSLKIILPIGSDLSESSRDVIFSLLLFRIGEDLFRGIVFNQFPKIKEARHAGHRAACCMLWVTMMIV